MSTPATHRSTRQSLRRRTPASLRSSWQQLALWLLSGWLAVGPTVVLASSARVPLPHQAVTLATGGVPLGDGRLSPAPCQAACCCSAQVCRCCALEVTDTPPARIPTAGRDAVGNADQKSPHTTTVVQVIEHPAIEPDAIEPDAIERDAEKAVPRAALCDCGCQRPLSPPAIPGSTSLNVLLLLACRQTLHSFLSTCQTEPDSAPSTSPTTLGSKLLALGGPTRRQAALHRWLI